MTSENIPSFARARFGLGLLVLAMLAGCVDSPPWGGNTHHPTTAQIKAVLGRLDSYVYYPGYEIYYNSTTSQFVFWGGSAWVSGIEPPRRVPLEVLLGSPSVAMNFYDAPERHHAATVRSYPHDWGLPRSVMASSR